MNATNTFDIHCPTMLYPQNKIPFQVRPSYSSGVIAFVGPTEFANGIWVGVELDAPTGKEKNAQNGYTRFFFISMGLRERNPLSVGSEGSPTTT